MLEFDDDNDNVPTLSERISTSLRMHLTTMFFHFGAGMAALTMVALVAYVVYRIVDGWMPALDLCVIAMSLLGVIVISYIGNALNIATKPDAYREFIWACNWEDEDEDLMDGVPGGVLLSPSAQFAGGRGAEVARR